MKIVTLTSDWQLLDPYVGMFKGQMLAQIPDVNIVDLTHQVEALNINQASFLMKNSCIKFPSGTVHLCLLGATDLNSEDPILVCKDGHFFIGSDEGVFSLMFFPEIEQLGMRRYKGDAKGHFSKLIDLCAACWDGSWEEKTEAYSDFKRIRPFEANYFAARRHISGHVIYIDALGNVVTNIPVEMFEKAVAGGSIRANVGGVEIKNYYTQYVKSEVPYFIPNSLGMMEIATYGGHIALLAYWQRDENVEIDCFPATLK